MSESEWKDGADVDRKLRMDKKWYYVPPYKGCDHIIADSAGQHVASFEMKQHAQLAVAAHNLYLDNEWKDYHEPLARIFREVLMAYPDWKRIVDRTIDWDESQLIDLIINDTEVACEIETLIRTMVEEVKNEQ